MHWSSHCTLAFWLIALTCKSTGQVLKEGVFHDKMALDDSRLRYQVYDGYTWDGMVLKQECLPDTHILMINVSSIKSVEKTAFDGFKNCSFTILQFLSNTGKDSAGVFKADFSNVPFRYFTLTHNRNIDFSAMIFSKHTETISLENNSLTYLPDGYFHDLTSLTTLLLDDNKLNSVPESSFKGLEKLKILYLNKNELKSLPGAVFRGLNALEDLNMEDNKLTTLEESLFEDLEKLKVLYLRRNDLSSLPEGLFSGLKSLEKLYVSSIKLASLPESSFKGLEKMKILDLSKNDLKSFPEAVFQGLKSLEKLNMSSNKLTTLPKTSFKDLEKLLGLYLQRNDLESFPEDLFRDCLKSLRKLDMSSNKLTTLPNSSFKDLEKLRTLNLTDNKLTRLSLSIVKLREKDNLIFPSIYVKGNNLKHVPLCFTQLEHFEYDKSPGMTRYGPALEKGLLPNDPCQGSDHHDDSFNAASVPVYDSIYYIFFVLFILGLP